MLDPFQVYLFSIFFYIKPFLLDQNLESLVRTVLWVHCILEKVKSDFRYVSNLKANVNFFSYYLICYQWLLLYFVLYRAHSLHIR